MEDYKLEEIKRAWQKRKRIKTQEEAERRKKAMEKAHKIAAFLKLKYRVNRVYLYGSLVWGKHFTAASDIDIFIDDFPEDANYWEAIAIVQHIAAPFPVSVVPAGNAGSGLEEKVIKEGIEL